jgi:hypothetical protein
MMRRLALAALVCLAPGVASAQFATIGPTPPVSDNGDRVATTAWVNNFFAQGTPLNKITGLGTGIPTALGTNIGVPGAPVINGGALGTPSSGIATNLTGTAPGLTAGNATTNANLTGDVTSVGNATTLTNAPVIAKVLTGFTSGVGTITAADSILSALQKLYGRTAGATLMATPANPTSTASTVGVMMGMGVTCSITPTWSSRVRIAWDGVQRINTGAASIRTTRYYGTGTPPSNAAAITGTALGVSVTMDFIAAQAGTFQPYSSSAVITGLTPGTTYWLDIAVATTNASDTALLNSMTCNANEF